MKAVHRDSQARATKGKTCQQCGKTFDAFKRNQKYCSRRCGGDAWIARHLVPATRKRMAARAGRVCQSCGATFDARRDSQVCCSKRCRERVRHGRTRTLNCVECGAAIPTSRRAHAKTCSLRCQKRNWNKRNREKVREQARRRYAARRAGNMQICPIAMSPRARWDSPETRDAAGPSFDESAREVAAKLAKMPKGANQHTEISASSLYCRRRQ